jgi:hypothetical protein
MRKSGKEKENRESQKVGERACQVLAAAVLLLKGGFFLIII